jgi:phage-related protein
MSAPDLNFSREEIEQMSRAMATVLLQHLPSSENPPEDPTRVYVIIPESLITTTLNLDLLASSEHGLSDILGQISGFFQSIINKAVSTINGFIEGVKNAVRDFIRGAVNQILDALADFTARVISKLVDYMGPKFIQLGNAIADVIVKISNAIATSVVTISSAIATSINMVAGALSTAIAAVGTSLSIAINQVGTSLAGTITMVGTSIATTITSIGYSLSQTILSVSTSIAAGIASIGASLSQTILSIGTSLSISIAQLGTSLAGTIVSIGTAISGTIVQIATSLAVAINQIGTSLATTIVEVAGGIANAINMVGTALGQAINQLSTSIADGIAKIGTALSTAITQVGTSIINVLGGLLATLAASVALLQGRVEVAIAIMQDYFPKFSEALTNNLKLMVTAIKDTGEMVHRAILEMSKTTADVLNRNMKAFADTLSDVMTKISNTILEISRRTNETLVTNMVRTIEAIAKTGERLATALANIHKSITDAIIASFENASRAIREAYEKFMDTLRDQFEKLSDALRDQYQKAIDAILKTGEKTIKFIEESSRGITDTILKNFEDFMNKLDQALRDLQNTLLQLAKDWEGFVNALLLLPDRLRPTMEYHAKTIWDILFEEKLAGWDVVWREWPRFFQKASPKSPFEALMALLIAATKEHPYGTVVIGDPPQAVTGAAVAGGVMIPAPAPPDPIQYILGQITGERVVIFTVPSLLFNPLLSAFSRYIIPALNDLWNKFQGAVSSMATTIINFLHTAAAGAQEFFTKTVINALQNLINAISGTVLEACKSVYATLGGVKSPPASPLYTSLKEFYKSQYGQIKDEIQDVVKELMVPEVTTILNALGLKAEEVMRDVDPEKTFRTWSASTVGFLLVPLWASLPVRLVAKMLHALGNYLLGHSFPINISLRPIGIGVSFKFDIAKAFGAAMSHFSRELKRYVDTIGQSLAYGIGIWVTQPVTRMLNFYLRNIIPAEIPTVEQMLEIIRRHMPLAYGDNKEEFENMYKMMKLFTALLGYPDVMFRALYTKVDELSVTIKDRFNQDRKIPISLMYHLPSPSDVARMVIRDVITDPKAIIKLFASRGMNEDVAVMYYLLHFRYPPPERLWTFYVRGISNLLWVSKAELPEDEKQVIRQILKAYEPVPPTKLNGKPEILEEMLTTYMKWHDYARFAYAPNWTSDNLIMMDTLADIPTKIDQRWMVRFGLYQLMSERGLTHESDVSSFCTGLVEGASRGNIVLDLTNFCRTLQATGLHPYWVPITAVAEVINTIADERTLLRTGVMNLFKEGFVNASAVGKMLTGILTASFKVAYFDVGNRMWRTGFINVPLRFLDMEAKLIGIRASMDRALDILRDIQRDVLTGYQEFIIKDYDEFKKKFADVIDRVNALYASAYKAIVGEDLPNELKLQFIEEYYKPYTESLEIYREIWTIRRIRTLTQRWIGWIVYRIGYGVVKPEDIEELLQYMVETCRLPELEYKYIKKVMEFMQKLSLREYIPTPAQLATLAEYVRIDDKIIEKAFEQRGVPDEWRPIWKQYIQVRPLADDVRALISAYFRLIRAVKAPEKVPAEIQNAVKSLAARIGYGPEEMAILNMRVRIEEMIAELREYVPTPMQMATLAEYVKLPDSMINAVFEIRNVPEAWRSVWKNYIDVRPLADDVRDLIRTYLRALEYTSEAKAMEGLVMAYASRIGYGSDEMNMLQARARLEEMIYNAREYIPTPQSLATIVEVLPEARALFQDVVRVRRIPTTWQALWAKYIDIKPLIDDLKRYLSRAEQLYIRFMVKRDDFIKMIADILNKLGYTKDEQDLFFKITEFERWRNAWTELIGSVERLTSLSEYSPRAAKYALGKVYEMIDSLPIPQADKQELKAMWEEYIRCRPVKAEARLYITQLSNAYAEGLISDADFEKELNAMKQWGFSDDEIMFYKARAALMKARKLKLPLVWE